MLHDMSRILIETIVKKTLKDLKDSPERSIRNLVDTALHFSEGRFQQTFFSMAQTMLTNEQSPYYDLIKDTVACVDQDRLLQFGMNLGYNSCTVGARKIREKEAECGFNIPWMISLDLDGQLLSEEPERYDAIISQGEALGIYTWMLRLHGQLLEVLPLMQAHPECAFVLFCKREDITLSFLDSAADVHHMMLSVERSEEGLDIYSLLRERGFLYSMHMTYEDNDKDNILNGDLFYAAQQQHPLFTVLIPAPGCPEETRKSIYRKVVTSRNEQLFQTVPWEASLDSSYIDGIISDDTCSASFDKDGNLCTQETLRTKKEYNLSENPLEEILRRAFPKQKISS